MKGHELVVLLNCTHSVKITFRILVHDN